MVWPYTMDYGIPQVREGGEGRPWGLRAPPPSPFPSVCRSPTAAVGLTRHSALVLPPCPPETKNCAISTGTCNDTERWPGLWEFPMWDVQVRW